MLRFRIFILALVTVLLSTGAGGGCSPSGKHTEPTVKRTETVKTTQAAPGAEPVPQADPYLIEQAKKDPNMALLQVLWRTSDRTGTVSWYNADGAKPIVTGKLKGGTWQQVLIVTNGQKIGFTWRPDDNFREGYSECTIWHYERFGRVGAVKVQQVVLGNCSVSYTVSDG